MGADFHWTDDAVADMRRMLREGSSFSQIAAAIGCPSRNAVIGKARRVGVAPGRKRVAAEGIIERPARRAPKPAKVVRLVEPAPEPRPAHRDVPPPHGGVLFMERSVFACAMPLPGWDDLPVDEKRVCGRPVQHPTSYCPACVGIVYAPRGLREFKERSMGAAA